MLLPKPDIQHVVTAIHELTSIGTEMLGPHVGGVSFDAEGVLRQIITMSVEAGINLQRQAYEPDGIDQDDVITTKIPVPKLPNGV